MPSKIYGGIRNFDWRRNREELKERRPLLYAIYYRTLGKTCSSGAIFQKIESGLQAFQQQIATLALVCEQGYSEVFCYLLP